MNFQFLDDSKRAAHDKHFWQLSVNHWHWISSKPLPEIFPVHFHESCDKGTSMFKWQIYWNPGLSPFSSWGLSSLLFTESTFLQFSFCMHIKKQFNFFSTIGFIVTGRLKRILEKILTSFGQPPKIHFLTTTCETKSFQKTVYLLSKALYYLCS